MFNNNVQQACRSSKVNPTITSSGGDVVRHPPLQRSQDDNHSSPHGLSSLFNITLQYSSTTYQHITLLLILVPFKIVFEPHIGRQKCYTVSYKAILLCLRCTEVSRHLGWAKLAVGGSEYHAHATGFEWMTQGCERKQRINCVLQHLLYYTPILTAIYNMTRFSI